MPDTEMTKSVMETLAVIAWKQPIIQADVIKIRTNKAYEHIKELVGMGFVTSEKFGRTKKLKLTQKFLDYFDHPLSCFMLSACAYVFYNTAFLEG